MLKSYFVAECIGLSRTALNEFSLLLPLDRDGPARKTRGYSLADAILICTAQELVDMGLKWQPACAIVAQLKDDLKVVMLDESAERFVAVLRAPNARGTYDFTVSPRWSEVREFEHDAAVIVLNLRAAAKRAVRRLQLNAKVIHDA